MKFILYYLNISYNHLHFILVSTALKIHYYNYQFKYNIWFNNRRNWKINAESVSSYLARYKYTFIFLLDLSTQYKLNKYRHT